VIRYIIAVTAIAIASALGGSGRVGTASSNGPLPPTPSEIEASEGGFIGQRQSDGRLAVMIFPESNVEESARTCTFDASVVVLDGHVARVAQDAQARKVGLGELVSDLPAGLTSGRVGSVPVHFSGVGGALVGGYSQCAAADVRASSHAAPDPSYGYNATHWTLYPGRTGVLTWRAWTISGGAVTLHDALILIDALTNQWLPRLNTQLDARGARHMAFTGLAYNDSSAQLTYSRVDTQSQTDFFCGANTPPTMACFIASASSFDSARNRYEVTKATLVYGPISYSNGDAVQEKIMAHEFGHGLGLAHHAAYPNCETVMSTGLCTNLPAAADATTAVVTVYGY